MFPQEGNNAVKERHWKKGASEEKSWEEDCKCHISYKFCMKYNQESSRKKIGKNTRCKSTFVQSLKHKRSNNTYTFKSSSFLACLSLAFSARLF